MTSCVPGDEPRGAARASIGGSAETATTTHPDRRAFERLTLPHLTDVARFARSLMRDSARADDLVQETYLQALRGWHTFQDGSDAKRWLFTICHHAFLRIRRRESRYVEAPDDDPELESFATAITHAEAIRSGVAAAAEHMDLGLAITRALATLPANFLGAVILVDVEGQTYEDASLVLEIPIGTLRSRLFRARRLLQDQLLLYAQDAGFTSAKRVDASASSDPSISHPRRATES